MSNEYFTKRELTCPCGCDESRINPDSLEKLIKIRKELNFALPVTSSYRCLKYNKMRGFTQTHQTGQAFDISVSRGKALALIKVALSAGFTGVGVQQKGDKRFIHLDDLPNSASRPRPSIWSY